MLGAVIVPFVLWDANQRFLKRWMNLLMWLKGSLGEMNVITEMCPIPLNFHGQLLMNCLFGSLLMDRKLWIVPGARVTALYYRLRSQLFVNGLAIKLSPQGKLMGAICQTIE